MGRGKKAKYWYYIGPIAVKSSTVRVVFYFIVPYRTVCSVRNSPSQISYGGCR